MPDEGGVVIGNMGQLNGGGVGGESAESTWRGRALQAEEKIKELEQNLAALRAELEAGKRTLDAIAQRREVERQLIDAKAQDVESALLLVEQTLAKGDEKDVGRVVAEVKQRKPHLFEPAKIKEAVAMGAGGGGGVERYESAVERAFEKARGTGGTRKSLLEYLRAKRA